MTPSMGKTQSRRDLLRTVGRAVFLLFTIAAAAYATRPGRGPAGRCVRPGMCSGCPSLPSCDRPESAAAKGGTGENPP